MTKDLRDFVKALPLSVRRELTKIPNGFQWKRSSTGHAYTHCDWFDSGIDAGLIDTDRFLWLPVSAVAIIAHAVTVHRDQGWLLSGCGEGRTLIVDFAGKPGLCATHPNDPTGHKVACEILTKAIGADREYPQ